MKFRKDFVTNSSSSAFICEICSYVAIGYDINLSDYDMYECECGHAFCQSHMELTEKQIFDDVLEQELIKAASAENQDYLTELEKLRDAGEVDIFELSYITDIELRYALPKKYCPICQLHAVPDTTVLDYLLARDNISLVETKKEISSNFRNNEDLNTFVRNRNNKK